ncbi:hypothetical protein GLAREA_07074 [Glarea lozoyensis ATCC 20868]|uniref:Uncharacterized protein n=1 Tax=Glarea lozoyensis (strain ATCC 20868 / MF5171) TaxID=1116229 RepID=S3DPQ3_GLAL2|nr:uncharacterized protein GLAREA_07074 [Glarea lozoyensis ATCC 20868]EPE34061.1 hypothetical protein GLAREA_07074 [Glarea lozoyensis ATCC 20868]
MADSFRIGWLLLRQLFSTRAKPVGTRDFEPEVAAAGWLGGARWIAVVDGWVMEEDALVGETCAAIVGPAGVCPGSRAAEADVPIAVARDANRVAERSRVERCTAIDAGDWMAAGAGAGAGALGAPGGCRACAGDNLEVPCGWREGSKWGARRVWKGTDWNRSRTTQHHELTIQMAGPMGKREI